MDFGHQTKAAIILIRAITLRNILGKIHRLETR